MLQTKRILIAATFLLIGFGPELRAGGLHIRYEKDAPEKLAAANEKYYEGVLNLYHNHSAAFDHDHPFYVRMFSSPAMMDRLVARWEAHEQRFEYWHFCLWKVLDGYLESHKTLTLPPTSIPFPISSGVSAQGSGGNGNGNSNSNGNGVVGALSVPEPSTWVLWVSGLLVGSGWLARRHASLARGSRIARASSSGSRIRLGPDHNPPA